MSSKNCIIIRTNYIDKYIENKSVNLENITGYDVIICIDCIFSDVVYNGKCKHIKLTKDFLFQNNLLILNNSGWLCGDYSYYCVSKFFNDYKFYWMIEPDVFLNFDNYSDFFRKIDESENNSFDYISSYFGEATTQWAWTGIISLFYKEKLYKSFFPVTRLSKLAIDYLIIERIRISSMFFIINKGVFPNDESFIATSLMKGNFKCCDINYFGDFYTEETLNYSIPFSMNLLETEKSNNKIYHPALSGLFFIKKLQQSIKDGYINDRNVKNIYNSLEFEKKLLNLTD